MRNLFLFCIFVAFLSCSSSRTSIQEGCPLQAEVGVVINGVRWATRNVASFGQFAIQSDSVTFYTWGGKQAIDFAFIDRLDFNSVRNSFYFTPRTGMERTAWRGHSAFGPTFNLEAMTWDASMSGRASRRPVWSRRNDPCPPGWRVPTNDEWRSLLNTLSVWTTIDGVKGRMFGVPPNVIFLPADGYFNFHDEFANDEKIGSYWSRTPRGAGAIFQFLHFSENTVEVRSTDGRLTAMSVRCVARN